MGVNYYTLFGLFLLATTCASEDCNAEEKTIQQLCKSIHTVFKQDHGKFSKYFCGCVTGFLKADFSYCHASEYDFKAAPKCKKMIQSPEVEKIFGSKNLFSNFIINGLFKTLFDICENDSETLTELTNSVFEKNKISKLIEFVMKEAFSSEFGNLFVSCYEQLLEIADIPNKL